MKTAAKKVNEIEKIIIEGEIADGNNDTFIQSKAWMRRKLRALVRKAFEDGQEAQYRVQTKKESWLVVYSEFAKKWGFKP